MNEIEIRKINEPVILNERRIEGYASVFNSKSLNLGGFYEVIDPSAADDVLMVSNVFALIDHDKSKGILARSKYGVGTLNLNIDAKGIKYSFDAPKTALGDEAIEYLKRGDIDSSSFAFTVKSDKWDKLQDGMYLRTILKFERITDCSLVYDAAYPDTSVALKRFAEIQEADKNKLEEIMNEEIKVDEEVIEEIIENIEEPIEESIEEIVEIEEIIEEERNETIEEIVEIKEETIEEIVEEKRNTNADENVISQNRNLQKMENFKLIGLINDVINNRSTEKYADILNAGKAEFRNAGISTNGQIQLPLEYRAITATDAGYGIENVPEQKMNILEPLKNSLVLAQAGAQIMTGLVGDVSIPVLTAGSCYWAGETVAATGSTAAFTEISMKPLRLSAYLDVSKQFLIQDSNDANNVLTNDLASALAQKIEATWLGTVSGSTTAPDGIFAGSIANDFAATGFTYDNVLALEALVEAKNLTDYTLIASPSAKFQMKGKMIGTSGQPVWAMNEVDGHKAISTGNIADKKVVIGDFKDLIIAQWGGVEILVDPYSQAVNGNVRLVINGYFNVKARRDSFVVAVAD